MKNLTKKLSTLSMGLYVYSNVALAQNKLIKPSGVDSVNVTDITDKADSASTYIIAILSGLIVLLIFGVAYLYVSGKIQEANEKVIGIIFGLLVLAFGSGIVFAIFG